MIRVSMDLLPTMHEIDPKLSVQILQFLLTLYNLLRSRSKPSADRDDAHVPDGVKQVPNPEKLKEVIKEVEQGSKQNAESISAAIDKRFPASEAQQVKDDFATYAVLASPPNFADYDFAGLIQKYAKQMQAIAFKTDLFRLCGLKVNDGMRILKMNESAAALLPLDEARSLLYPIGQIVSASVAERQAVLTDEKRECPILIAVAGNFGFASRAYDSGSFQTMDQPYRIGPGQENNWLQFYMEKRGSYIPFTEHEYRLNAAKAREILAALRHDIVSYLRDLEKERPILHELRQELDGVASLIPKRDV